MAEKTGPGVLKPNENPLKITDEEWEKRLTKEQYRICREKGTERPFTGQYTDHFDKGLYHCTCCGADLFVSDTKYDHGCGWPAFTAAKGAKGTDETDANVLRHVDKSHGMVRTEVVCKKCNAHLGHVFDDGPGPTGERFCINSASLKFAKK